MTDDSTFQVTGTDGMDGLNVTIAKIATETGISAVTGGIETDMATRTATATAIGLETATGIGIETATGTATGAGSDSRIAPASTRFPRRSRAGTPILGVLHPAGYFGFASERLAPVMACVSGGGRAAPANSGVLGLQKVSTPSLTLHTALVLDRMAATLLATSDGHDNLSRNLTTLLAR